MASASHPVRASRLAHAWYTLGTRTCLAASRFTCFLTGIMRKSNCAHRGCTLQQAGSWIAPTSRVTAKYGHFAHSTRSIMVSPSLDAEALIFLADIGRISRKKLIGRAFPHALQWEITYSSKLGTQCTRLDGSYRMNFPPVSMSSLMRTLRRAVQLSCRSLRG